MILLPITSLSSFLPPTLPTYHSDPAKLASQGLCTCPSSCLQHFLQVSSCVTSHHLQTLINVTFLLRIFLANVILQSLPRTLYSTSLLYFFLLIFYYHSQIVLVSLDFCKKTTNQVSQNNRYLFSHSSGG